MNEVRVRGVASGRVQGVSYRWSAVAQAEQLGLTGWVSNLPDGRVEFEAEGPQEAVDAFVDWSHRGPDEARVTGVDVTRIASTGEAGFAIRY